MLMKSAAPFHFLHTRDVVENRLFHARHVLRIAHDDAHISESRTLGVEIPTKETDRKEGSTEEYKETTQMKEDGGE